MRDHDSQISVISIGLFLIPTKTATGSVCSPMLARSSSYAFVAGGTLGSRLRWLR
jgi:hypothetical protein